MPYIGRPIGVAGHTTQKLDDPTGISSNAFTMKVATVAISPDAASLQIYVDGVRQEAGVAYTVSGSTITFTGTFTSSNDFHGYVMGDAMYIQTNSVDSDHYVDGSIDNAHLADDAVDSDELAAGAVDLAHMSVNSIDSDQYVDGSIDNAHLADDAVDSDELAAGSVDIAHLSASGTAGSGNFLRGDNSWTAVTSPAITSIAGTAANQILTDDGDATVTSESNLTYDGTTFGVDDAAVFNESGNDNDFRVEGSGVENALFVQGSDGNVGIGAVPDLGDGLHIKTADSGASINAEGSELVIENSGASGISILSGTSSAGRIFFGDSGNGGMGGVHYDHSDNHMEFIVSDAEAMRIASDGAFTMGSQSQFREVEKDSASMADGAWRTVAQRTGEEDGLWLVMVGCPGSDNVFGTYWFRSYFAGSGQTINTIFQSAVAAQWDGDNLQVSQGSGAPFTTEWCVYQFDSIG